MPQAVRLAWLKRFKTETLQGFQAGKFAITDVQQTTNNSKTFDLAKCKLLAQAWQERTQC